MGMIEYNLSHLLLCLSLCATKKAGAVMTRRIAN
jgi:hypothetical protein